MFKPKKQRIDLITVIPFDIYNQLLIKLGVEYLDCKGVVEHTKDRDIWFGFVNRRPMRFTYRESDQKCTWAPCHLDKVKEKIRELESIT